MTDMQLAGILAVDLERAAALGEDNRRLIIGPHGTSSAEEKMRTREPSTTKREDAPYGKSSMLGSSAGWYSMPVYSGGKNSRRRGGVNALRKRHKGKTRSEEGKRPSR